MSRNTKRRAREAEKRDERLHYKFITEYVKCLHKDIHDKAEELFNSIRHQYPNVKDLTKTVEYMNVVMPSKPIPRYYQCRRSDGTRSNTKSMSQMVLEIPLIPLNPNTSLSVAAPSPPVASPPVASPPVAAASPPVAASLHLPLSDNVYQALLSELQQDPDLWRIINDFPIDDSSLEDNDMDDFLHNDIWDAIIPDDVTPIESELEAVFDNIV